MVAAPWPVAGASSRPWASRLRKLSPFGGFAAETAGGFTLCMNAVFGISGQHTHTITGAIVGVVLPAVCRPSRWGIHAPAIIYAWILTIPWRRLFAPPLQLVHRRLP